MTIELTRVTRQTELSCPYTHTHAFIVRPQEVIYRYNNIGFFINKSSNFSRTIIILEMEHDHEYSWLPSLGFGILTYNSVRAIYNSNGDMGSISFVLVSYLDLLLLFWCIRLFEKTAPESPNRERIKIAVWILSTVLTVMFTSKVGAMMPFFVGLFISFVASASCLGGFYMLFLYQA